MNIKKTQKTRSILFVCLGNICRSPMAEGIFTRHIEDYGLSDEFRIDSAGTGNWHVGQKPNIRAQKMCLQKGIDISNLRARTITKNDIINCDLILAMDESNLHDVKSQASNADIAKIVLMLDYSNIVPSQSVPDPYDATSLKKFEYVYKLLEESCYNLATSLAR